MADDLRRLGQIEVRQDSLGIYRLTINGVLWSSVEWSGSKCCWCVEDACNRCLEHVEHIFGEAANPDAAIKMAKRMIRDGQMPTPEEAVAAVERLEAQKAQQQTEGKVLIVDAGERVLLPIKAESPDEETAQ